MYYRAALLREENGCLMVFVGANDNAGAEALRPLPTLFQNANVIVAN